MLLKYKGARRQYSPDQNTDNLSLYLAWHILFHPTNLLPTWNRIIPGQLLIPSASPKFPAFYVTHTLRLWDPFQYYPPIYAYLFQMVSFLQVSPQKPCTHFSSPHSMPRASAISCSTMYDSNNTELPKRHFFPTSIIPKNTSQFQAHVSVMTATDSTVLWPHRQLTHSLPQSTLVDLIIHA